jgi:hypothetical protein
MATRAERADQLLRDKEWEFTVYSNQRMKVPSQQTAHLPYTVYLGRHDGRRQTTRVVVSGSCPDYVYRRPAGGCKHMIAAERYLRKHPAERKWKF